MLSDDEFGAALVKVARQHSAELKKLPKREWAEYVRRAMEHSGVVYAIWRVNDDQRCCGCIKGINPPEGTKVPVTASHEGYKMAITAFFVKSGADAEGMKRDWGDGLSTMNWPPTPITPRMARLSAVGANSGRAFFFDKITDP